MGNNPCCGGEPNEGLYRNIENEERKNAKTHKSESNVSDTETTNIDNNKTPVTTDTNNTDVLTTTNNTDDAGGVTVVTEPIVVEPTFSDKGILLIKLIKAVDVPQADAGIVKRDTKCDPYVKIYGNEQELKSKTIKKTCNPEFNEELIPLQVLPNKRVKFEIWDWDKMTKDDLFAMHI
eukprot:CAMPEP_0114661198 /NCGR_PEP_ID=MMETSP0191-20121206/21893_1 /TAXON_ID=126664 /ORGANISM="Sorites sp." /LENGTH=177 /DNA_ID=CAMNT_0001892751 /DNA_START=35 /DNA_END=569 /DNA_ORIENTATION=+